MDQPLRAPWRAMTRYTLYGIVVAAALVLLTLVLGARPASAATTDPQPSQQRGLVGGLVHGLGDTVQGVTSGVGRVVERTVEPTRTAVAPPKAPTPASPAPAPVVPAPTPVAAAPVPAAPVPAAPVPAASSPAPSSPAPAAPAPPPATSPAAPTGSAPTTGTGHAQPATGATPATPATVASGSEAGSASRPVTDTLVTVLRPATGAVEHLTAARPVTTVVGTLDQVVGCLPVLGTVLGDDTLGTVTRPVTGLVDDTLGGVGSAVGSVPDAVAGVPPVVGGVLPGGTDPVVDVPGTPVRGGSTAPSGSTTSGVRPDATTASADVTPPRSTTTASTDRSEPADPRLGDVATVVAADPEQLARTVATNATIGGRALLVPGGSGTGNGGDPLDGPVAGVLGSSATGSTGPAAAVGIVGSTGDQISLAAGSRGTLSDDAVPASVVGEHDVAPD